MIPLRYNINSLLLRRMTTVSVILGIAMFVFIITLVQMFRSGIQNTVVQSNGPENIIVLSTGAINEMSSFLDRTKIDNFLSLPEVDVTALIGEFVIIKLFDRLDGGGGGNVIIRGVPQNLTDFRSGLQIIEGHKPSPEKNEVMIGERVSERFVNMKLGDRFELGNNQFVTVVGIFKYQNSSLESEIWGDLDVIRGHFGREKVISSLRMKLNKETTTLFQIQQAAKAKELDITVMREENFLNAQARNPKQFITMIGVFFTLFISVAAIIATSTVMHASVANRRQEIVMLRNIGFSTRSILASFLIEPVLLGIIGSVLGIVLSLGLATFKLSIMNVSTWSQLVVGFDITLATVVTSLVAGAIIGLAGGLFPAIKTVKYRQA